MDAIGCFQDLMTMLCQAMGREVYGDRRRVETLAWAVVGLLSSQRVALSAWGEAVVSRARLAASHTRRFARWVDNPRIRPMALYEPILLAALQPWPTDQRLRVALDSSHLPDGLLLVRVALIYRGRAVPVCWRVVRHASATIAYEVYEPLLQTTARWLSRFPTIELSADRGFFHQRLIEFCACQHWHFRLRAPSDTLVWLAEQWEKTLTQLTPRRGAAHFYQQVKVMKSQLGPFHLALAHPAWTEKEDPWYVFSDEPTSLATFDEYGLRFDIEEGFLDDKSGGFQVEDCELKEPQSWERLFLILAVATLYLTSMGATVVTKGWRRWVDSHWERGLSYFQLGWRWLRQQALKCWPRLASLALDPAPDPQPACASRRQFALPPHTWAISCFPP
jgi:hypothetical protein